MAREEIFGPILVILQFETEEEAIKLANDSDYGLGAGVLTQNMGIAERSVRAIEAGTVWINCYNVNPYYMPFGGYKQSGFGKDIGEESLSEFTRTKAVYYKW